LLIMSAGFLAVQSPRYRVVLWSAVACGMIGLWVTKSRTPLAALVAAGALLWFFTVPWKQRIAWGLGAVFVICSLLLIAGDALIDRISNAALLGRTEADEVGSLSGRLPLWDELSHSVAERPLEGYGYSSY